MAAWDSQLEQTAIDRIRIVCENTRTAAERSAAWRQLLSVLAPHIEARAARSRVLRRCGLANEDDVRAILVGVIERMRSGDHDNLRAFLARRGAAEAPPADARIADLDRLARLTEQEPGDAGGPSTEGRDDTTNTPLRAWILRLVDFVTQDHVRSRLGWSSTARLSYPLLDGASVDDAALDALRSAPGIAAAQLDRSGLHLVVEFQPSTLRPDAVHALVQGAGFRVAAEPALGPTRRDVNTDAERFDRVAEPTVRPPITDFLTLSRIVAAMREHAGTFPPAMRRALELWLDDTSFEDIARAVGEPDAERARALVRAAQARLRERFRGEWPEVFGA
jgi:hypothetical protein